MDEKYSAFTILFLLEIRDIVFDLKTLIVFFHFLGKGHEEGNYEMGVPTRITK